MAYIRIIMWACRTLSLKTYLCGYQCCFYVLLPRLKYHFQVIHHQFFLFVCIVSHLSFIRSLNQMLRFLSQVLQRLEVSRCRKIETLILSLFYTKFLEPHVQSHQTKVISCYHALQIHSLLTSITFIFCALLDLLYKSLLRGLWL